jgi:hypothetical protein
MKKIILFLLVILSQLVTNCSNNNSSSSNSSSNSGSFGMKINGVDCNISTPTTNATLYWDLVTNSDGSHYYKIVALFRRNGITYTLPNNLTLKLKTENLTVNQIFPASSQYSPSNPISMGVWDGGDIRLYTCNSSSTGQVKITQFDGVTMSGVFSFTDLFELSNYTTMPFANVTDGVFTNIPKKN